MIASAVAPEHRSESDHAEGDNIIHPLEFQNIALQQRVRSLEQELLEKEQRECSLLKELSDQNQKIRELLAQNRMVMQLCQALGDFNRHCARVEMGHFPSDEEAFQFYIVSGGKSAFDLAHPPPS